MGGVDAPLHGLQPIALDEELGDQQVIGRHQGPLQVREAGGLDLWTHVGPDDASRLAAGVGGVAHFVLEPSTCYLVGHVDALAVQGVSPAVIRAAQAGIFDAAEVEGGTPVGAVLGHQPRLTILGAEDHQILAHQAHPLGAVSCRHLVRQHHWDPVLPQEVAHSSACANAGQQIILISSHHR